ncbi:uncharacterized protein LAESUDRAFT_718239 [Laetiporus sulphureus 93-53]|uniref:Uncharacterized protein n=1 Tax=Laetiporus sulphureus 93-53 TaxID=1314785 RepID=A0A165B530_9APHY|nr:uncharacterized protein LAESUDRAFT_718239 [Laetiporus sulphureus 93-53]KZT00256.1 hypothetical protein LAESUDRAFT_718239 [Laetiporus sulphureus 93-53]
MSTEKSTQKTNLPAIRSRTSGDGYLRRRPSANLKYQAPASASFYLQSPDIPSPEKPESIGSSAYLDSPVTSYMQTLQDKHKVPKTPIGRVHQRPRLPHQEMLAMEISLYGGERTCIMELVPASSGIVDFIHIMGRATSEDELLLFEYNTGLFPYTMNLDCSQNLERKEKDLEDMIKKLPEYRNSPPKSRIPQFSEGFEQSKWKYTVVATGPDSPCFVRHHENGEREIIYPPYNLKIESSVHPMFVFMNTTSKLKEIELKNGRPPERHRVICEKMLSYRDTWDTVSAEDLKTFK